MITQTLPVGQTNCKAIQAVSSEIFRAQALAALLTSPAGMTALEQLDDCMRVALFAHHADHLKSIVAQIDAAVEQGGFNELATDALLAAISYVHEAQAVADMMSDPDAIQWLIDCPDEVRVALVAGHAGRLGNARNIFEGLDETPFI
ncbi:hypothetical protein [Ottowia sp.]|uniref:hypothetical protein n=1 Tax=Ottowia sp. TaxID=1898956 RepID=UPI002C7510AC|nr:hypothetical protein [Ottowia sp.]HOB66636.1 hypothetical protein [Ottowia sp.]HPZ56470.1 hypothetical protein [Ottowia sp.]HQD47632.1 hypothetical protein [Ottowia sp.]